MSQTIIYEHPLTEKVRCYLRLENLSNQLFSYKNIENPELFKPFFNVLFALSEQFDKGELKKELIRDLAQQKKSLQQWRCDDSIDQVQLEKLLNKIDSFNFYQTQSPKPQDIISQDALLTQIKNKASLLGGGSPFDTPLLHYWNHLPIERRLDDIEQWIAPFLQTIEAVTLLLKIIRDSSVFKECTAQEGFYQNSCEQLQLLRIKTMAHQGYFPVISGYKNRYAVRFQSRNEQPTQEIKFLLSCC